MSVFVVTRLIWLGIQEYAVNDDTLEDALVTLDDRAPAGWTKIIWHKELSPEEAKQSNLQGVARKTVRQLPWHWMLWRG
jgi:hypothetical protein